MSSALVLGTTAADAAVAITFIVTVGAVIAAVVWQVLGLARAKTSRDWDREVGR